MPGDSLSKIAQGVYGDPQLWKLIHQMNPQIQNPNIIQPGQLLNLPEQKDFLSDGALAADDVQEAQVVETKILAAGPGNGSAGKWVALGFVLLAAALLGHEAMKEKKKGTPAKKKGKSLSGTGLKPEQVKVGDYVLLTTSDGERAKVKITSTTQKRGRFEVDGVTTYKGKRHKVLFFTSDFEKGNVRKISKNTKVKQVFK